MSHEYAMVYLYMIFPFGIIFALMLIVYEDGNPASVWNKVRCKMGKHIYKTRWGNVNLYYCRTCRKPRSHPILRLIKGGNKMTFKG